MVGPDRFVPVAEDIGLIHPIGEWVLREACAQMVAWQKSGIAPQTLSVNISAHQIAVADFVDMIESVLEDTALDGRCLELEITEGVLNSVPYVEQTLLALKQLGVTISIDDFGTGLSSIGNLRHLPVRKLKIDRSFVLDIGRDGASETVVRAVIGLGASFGLTVIAEGVETEVQAEFLRKSGCQQFQGYLLGRAVTPEDFAAYFSPVKEPI
jgi:EAL domain-containing protein (putative c-di-GMP-specific phosphodiesterase class I)